MSRSITIPFPPLRWKQSTRWAAGCLRSSSRGVTIIQSCRNTPVACWPLAETSGSSVADLAGSNTGTLHGGVTLNQSPGLIAESTGAPLFDGSTGYVDCGTLGNLGSNLGSGLTLEAWIETTATGSLYDVMGSYEGSYHEYVLMRLNQNSTNTTYLADSLSGCLWDHAGNRLWFDTVNAGISDGKPHFVVITFSPSASGTPTGAIYIDGQPRNGGLWCSKQPEQLGKPS